MLGPRDHRRGCKSILGSSLKGWGNTEMRFGSWVSSSARQRGSVGSRVGHFPSSFIQLFIPIPSCAFDLPDIKEFHLLMDLTAAESREVAEASGMSPKSTKRFIQVCSSFSLPSSFLHAPLWFLHLSIPLFSDCFCPSLSVWTSRRRSRLVKRISRLC